jgi:hypothetical protein
MKNTEKPQPQSFCQTLENGFSFTKEAILPLQPQPQLFQPQPQLCQRGPKFLPDLFFRF